jgi:hypothetical protein
MMKRNLLILLVFLMLSSCTNVGPMEIPGDRYNYNESLQYSEMQQHLLNIVRLRYSDPPYFLAVNSIVAQFNYQRIGKGGVSGSDSPPPAILGQVQGEIAFADKPTITFSPIQGTEFVTRMMTPIDLSVVYMLLRAGWGINHIFRPIVQRFNHIDNAIIASRVTSSRIPQYKEFMGIGESLLKLQHADSFIMTRSEVNGKFAIHFRILSLAALNSKDRANIRKLGVDEEHKEFWLVENRPEKPNEFYVQTRTVLGMFNYFSKAVDVPEIDIKNKQAPITFYPNGQRFNWHDVTKGMLEVRSSPHAPSNAFVSVWYRKKWFYISNSDFESKETMNLIMIVMGIYQGKIEGFLPVFTVS